MVDIHGGAWSAGHRKNGRHYCRRLAENGIAVLAIDFRHAPAHQHPTANMDIRAAIQFARDTLEVNVSSLGLIGSSSGGHLALLSGLKPDVAAHMGTLVSSNESFAGSTTSAVVDFVIALWPVSNPLARFHYATARAREFPDTLGDFQPLRLIEGHRAYFETEQAMQDASIQRILAESDHNSLPGVFIVQPELDQNVPVFMSQTLHGAFIESGANVTYKLYEGVEHGFAQAEGPKTDECIDDMVAFILQR